MRNLQSAREVPFSFGLSAFYLLLRAAAFVAKTVTQRTEIIFVGTAIPCLTFVNVTLNVESFY